MATIRIATAKTFLLSIFLGVFLLSGLNSCEKGVSPNKVGRVIVKGSWRITSFLYEDNNIEGSYNAITLGFGESGSLTVLPSTGTSGSWEMGISKNPSLLYITGFFEPMFFILNEDWEVVSCSNKIIMLESQNGAFLNQITLRKIE
jgi:hypothetical protein